MAADSMFGGGTDLSQVVSTASLAVINRFLTDSVGGSAVTGSIGGSTVVVASGSAGEKQGALLPAGSAIAGNINDGVLSLDIQVPAGSGFVFEGRDQATPESVGNFLSGIIDSYLPPSDNAVVNAARDSLNRAVNDFVGSLNQLGATNIVVRLFNPISGNTPRDAAQFPESSHSEMLFDTTGSGGNELFMFNLVGLNSDTTLVLAGVENVLLAGAGNVRIQGNTGARVSSDLSSQIITGGGGNDTLIGGGGSDTLTGGAGADTFGFMAFGNFTITDFTPGSDAIAFKVGGIKNIFELLPHLTSVTQTSESLSLGFGPNFSLTLVGVSVSDLTADMIKFTF